MHFCNHNTWEAEVGGHELEASLDGMNAIPSFRYLPPCSFCFFATLHCLQVRTAADRKAPVQQMLCQDSAWFLE